MLAMSPAVLSILVVVITVYAVDGCPIVFHVNGSCCEIKRNEFTFSSASQIMSGVYSITNFCGNHKAVAQGYCEPDSDGGGWLVVQRRKDGSVSFNRGWVEYEEGFGHLNGEFWYGLRPLNCLTSQGQWELRIDLTHSNGTKTYLHYKKFAVGSASDKYPLQISQYSGIYPVDPFSTHILNGMKFTTKDRDNDWHRSINCAVKEGDKINNGWWHRSCSYITLNLEYHQKKMVHDKVQWHYYPFTEMKIRPGSCA